MARDIKPSNWRELWRDDNTVDFSRKQRVYRNNNGVSSWTIDFSPEDQTVEVEWGMEINPSTNKKTYPISDHFEDILNYRSDRLNRGRVVRDEPRNLGPSFAPRFINDWILDETDVKYDGDLDD